MPINENLTHYAGKPVADFALSDTTFDIDNYTPRFRLPDDDDETVPQLLSIYAKLPEASRTQALVIGIWSYEERDSAAVVEALVAYRDKMPGLRALFFGDITSEENEMSWINQTDLSILWPSYPKLEQIGVRGANGLTLGRISSQALKSLTIETGGLPRRIIQEALAVDAPNLEHFELWIGAEDYGGASTAADFSELLAGKLFPKLKTLGLRNCDYSDAMAEAVAEAPVLERIETLDLSLGNLSDEGAEALLASPFVRGLKKLDLHHHYLSKAMMKRLKALGPEVDVSEQGKANPFGGEIYSMINVSE